MISGFNYKNEPKNGKPAVLPFGNGSVVLNNVDGKLETPFYEVVNGKVVERPIPGRFIRNLEINLSEYGIDIIELFRSGGGKTTIEDTKELWNKINEDIDKQIYFILFFEGALFKVPYTDIIVFDNQAISVTMSFTIPDETFIIRLFAIMEKVVESENITTRLTVACTTVEFPVE